MYVGHINLEKSFNHTAEKFINLVDSLQQLDLRQYVIVRNVALARRLDGLNNVTVGPVVRSPITAYCLMPPVDVVHIHDHSGWQAGLLLFLTKSIPFVLTQREANSDANSSLASSIYKRAAGLIDETEISADEHLHVYRSAAGSLRMPTMIL